jgi:hypothetical protein
MTKDDIGDFERKWMAAYRVQSAGQTFCVFRVADGVLMGRPHPTRSQADDAIRRYAFADRRRHEAKEV